MKKRKLKTLLVASLCTVFLASSFFNVKAYDAANLEKTLGSAAIVNNLSGLGERTITLITGDIIKIQSIEDGKSIINVEPADKSAAGVQVVTVGENTYVLPTSAMPYLADGKLDKELFNVTKLIADGYDDKSLSSLPIIVQYTGSSASNTLTASAALTKKVDPKGAKKIRVLESINGAALETSKKEAKTFWKDVAPKASQKAIPTFDKGIEKIWLDGRVKATLDQSVPQIGAPTAWESGFTGNGVKVAVLDTGIDASHPDFKDKDGNSIIAESQSFVPGQAVDDYSGHGTHCASTIAGTGAASDGKYKGVAPGAHLVVGKVLGNDGTGLYSWILAGMEWASHNAKIVSMSLGGGISDGTDPMSLAINNLSKETGALFVIAAGNSGQAGEGSIGAPGAAEAALTVSAVDKEDKLAYFSSRGPLSGSMELKPDIAAPGVGIVAALSTLLGSKESYLSLSGTSMATPHVAGAAAILLQKHPEWNGTQLKETLMSTSKKLDYSPYYMGAGRVDVAAAVNSAVHATGSLSFGGFPWPSDKALPVQKSVTYTNINNSDVTLNLKVDFKNADGKNVPDGLLTVSEKQITVPANGTKEVTVTVDPKLGDCGRYEGQITAIDSEGKQVAHTSIGLVKEAEKIPLTFNAKDRNGNPASTIAVLVNNKNMKLQIAFVNGTTVMKLPAGIYSAMAYMEVDNETDHSGIALVGNPEIKLDSPQTVELDAREAQEISVEVPKKTEPNYRRMEYCRVLDNNQLCIHSFWLYQNNDKMYAAPTKKPETGTFEYVTRWRLIKPYLEINFKGKVLDDIPMNGSKLLDGNYNLLTVYAAKGTPADYKNLKANGKAVVVDRNTEITLHDQAAAAQAAGAKLLIIVNNEDKEFYEYVGNEDGTNIPLAVAGISKSEGDGVIAAARSGKLHLQVKAEAKTPYLYDLMDVHKDQIPSNIKYAPSDSELVRIDTTYKSDREALGSEFRYDVRPLRKGGIGLPIDLYLPSVRTEWVSVDKDTIWTHQANVSDNQWEVRQPLVTYDKSQRLQQEWFSPVVRPRFGEGYMPPYRQGNNLQFNIPAWADSGIGSTGQVSNAESIKNETLKLYQGTTLLQEAQGQTMTSKLVPDGKTQYRLVSDAKRDPNRWKTSISTHTEWTFWSQYVNMMQTTLPLYSLDYKVDTDMNGTVNAAPSTPLELSVAKLEGVEGFGKLLGATLEVSFNEGASWQAVKLERTADNKWVANIDNPKKSKNVSLRATAWDDLGNKISQDIIKAYGLR